MKRVSGREQQAEPVEGERRADCMHWRVAASAHDCGERETALYINYKIVYNRGSLAVLCRGPRFPLAAEAV